MRGWGGEVVFEAMPMVKLNFLEFCIWHIKSPSLLFTSAVLEVLNINLLVSKSDCHACQQTK